MRVLLTGHRGFIGSYVHEALIEAGYEVLISHHDLRQPLWQENVDYIINVAAKAEVTDSIKNPKEFIEENVLSTLSVLELARETKPKHVIHVSSAEVYGPGDHLLNSPHRPTNPYAASKAAQEDICRAYRETYKLPISIVVTQNVYGDRQPSHKFYPTIKKKIESGERVSVMPGVRRFTEVSYLANEIVKILNKPVGDHHVAGELRSNLNFARMIAHEAGTQLDYQLIEPDRPGHEDRYVLL